MTTGESDVLGRTSASYQDYVNLWADLMDPTRLKVHTHMHIHIRTYVHACTYTLTTFHTAVDGTSLFPQGPSLHSMDPGLRKGLHQLIYDEVVSTVFKIVNRLDLSSQTAPQEAEVSMRASWLRRMG